MRSFLLLLCIFSVTFSAKAQLFSKSWQQGYYCDASGHKFSGLLHHAQPEASVFKKRGDYITFKADQNTKQVKIHSDSISAFVIGADSFTVSHLKPLEKFPFLQVVINRPVKLFFSGITPSVIPIVGGPALAIAGSAIAGVAISAPGNSAYYFGSDPDNLMLLTNKNFIEVMTLVMADKPDVVEKVKNKAFKYRTLPDLLMYYQTGVMPKKQNDDIY
ncbi:hypothetical protein KHS38_03235 [Mucilaginibacter sp. Bleaf8]|uniref:hypothetical protein n=1 Tax=Mucilaginibacter sp. Bleaf8 TaxID=2834430 RepID=UPI001BD15FBD|nr:hypothetical protein [Mucilaginibacter sp. Bleaf8]MBS7563407.1 hypothetical protein [Mucilaginibacter sp. Bleaf8]